MAAAAEYEFRPAFRGDAYEWSPRPPEPAEPWTRLARHALLREWRIRAADASSGAVWSLRWEPVNRAGTRGAGLSVAPAQPDQAGGDSETALALLLEHCRHADGILALPPPAWHLVREGGEAIRAVLDASGRPAPQFQLRDLPDEERELLAPLAGLVCLEAAARPVDRSTRTFAAWALQRAAPDWLQRVVPPDRSRALEAFLARRSPLPGILTRVRQLDERLIRGAAEVERAVADLRKLADLAGAGGVRLRAAPQPPDGSFTLRLADGELQLPRDHEASIRIASSLGLDPPVTPPRPAPARSAAAATASPTSRPPWPALVLAFAATAGAFVVGRLTAPAPVRRNPGSAVVSRPEAEPGLDAQRTPAAAVKPRTPRPGARALDGPPALPFVLAEGVAAAGPDLAEPTCTTNGDVVRVEPDRLVIVPCGLRQPREAICVAGTCRLTADPVDDLPDTACGRDGTALVLDGDQKVYRPAAPATFTCPPAWYGVPTSDDPHITLGDPAPKPTVLKQAVRAWAQLVHANPRTRYTVVAYTADAPRPKEGCSRATTRLRTAAAKVLDALVAEQPTLKAQLIRPTAARTCAPSPFSSAGAATQAPATHVLLVRGSVPSCACTDPEPARSPKPAPRPATRPRRP